MANRPLSSAAQDRAFNRKYSRFKIVIYFKDGGRFTHYGNERINCTVDQINFKHVTNVLLDRKLGLNDCMSRIDYFKGKIKTAIIYDRKENTNLPDGTVQKGYSIYKWIGNNMAEASEPVIDPAIQQFRVVYEDKGWHLEKITTDFKTILNQKINK